MSSPQGEPGRGTPQGSHPAAAFIDLDGTLLSVSSEKLFLGALYREGMLGTAGLVPFAARYVLHPIRTATRGKGWNRSYLRGMDPGLLREFAMEFGRRSLMGAVRPWLADTVRELADTGWTTVLLTASLEPLATAAVEGIPFHRVIASIPGEAGGRLTGRLAGSRPWGREKVALACSVCDGMGIELESCMAMGDSWADRHLLEKCGTPVAVCPGERLRRLASRRSWAVMEGKRTNKWE